MKYLTIIILLIHAIGYSQVSIDKKSNSPSSILEFGNEEKVIVLPKVSTIDENTIPGTLIFNQQTGTVQFLSSTGWIDMNRIENTIEKYSQTEVGQGIVISDKELIETDAPGVLVLESNNKGLVLPKIYDVQNNINNPIPGSICYDTRRNAIAVYNGVEWSFWE